MTLLRRGQLAHQWSRTKAFAGRAWHNSQKVLSNADKVAALATRGLLALGDRLDPEVRQQAGQALQTYATGRRRMQSLTDNVQRVGRAVNQAGFEF